MKDIGYYAGFLTTEQQEAINKAELGHLTELTRKAITCLDSDHHINLGLSFKTRLLQPRLVEILSDRDKLALIRGLCDRIEIKLMEVAK